jgi:hypothetical protein
MQLSAPYLQFLLLNPRAAFACTNHGSAMVSRQQDEIADPQMHRHASLRRLLVKKLNHDTPKASGLFQQTANADYARNPLADTLSEHSLTSNPVSTWQQHGYAKSLADLLNAAFIGSNSSRRLIKCMRKNLFATRRPSLAPVVCHWA